MWVCFGSSSYQHQSVRLLSLLPWKHKEVWTRATSHKVTVTCVTVWFGGMNQKNQNTTHNRILILQRIKGLYDVWCVCMDVCVYVQDYSWLDMNCVVVCVRVCVCMPCACVCLFECACLSECACWESTQHTIEYGFFSEWKIWCGMPVCVCV